jgi:hypothetical protein
MRMILAVVAGLLMVDELLTSSDIYVLFGLHVNGVRLAEADTASATKDPAGTILPFRTSYPLTALF